MKPIQRLLVSTVICLLSSVNLSGAEPPGYVVSWGYNLTHEGTTDYWATGLVTVAGQTVNNARAITAGAAHALALRSDGTVVGWGANLQGEAVGFETPHQVITNAVVWAGGRPLARVIALSAGRYSGPGERFSLALRDDGTVLIWGRGPDGAEEYVRQLKHVAAISAGASHILALSENGTLASCGTTMPPPSDLTSITAIAAGGPYGRNLALRHDGSVTDWPVRSGARPYTVPVGLSNVVAIATGLGHSLALRSDGTVVGWGANRFGAATAVPTQTFPNESTGTVMIAHQILTNVTAIAAGCEHSMALRRDGTVVTWGETISVRVAVPKGLSDVVAIAAGEHFCLAITTNLAVAARFGVSSVRKTP